MEQTDIDLLVPSPLRQGSLPALSAPEIRLARAQGLTAFPPLTVREGQDGVKEIITGVRVWLLAQLIGEHQVTTITKDLPDHQAVILVADDMTGQHNPVTLASELRDFIRESGISKAEAGRRYGLQRSTVSNLLRLLEMDPQVIQMLRAGQLTQGHAKALHGLSHAQQQILSQKVVRGELSVRQTEALVKQLRQGHEGEAVQKARATAKAHSDPVMAKMEEDLTKIVGSPVSLHQVEDGWRICVDCHSLDAMEGVLQKLGYQHDEFDG